MSVSLLLLCTGQLFGQLRSAHLIPEPSVPILQNPHVQKELSLTKPQRQKLTSVFADFAAHAGLVAGAKQAYIRDAIGKNAIEQAVRFDELRNWSKNENAELRKTLYTVLTLKQRKRLEQLVFQYHLANSNYEIVFESLRLQYEKEVVRISDSERRKDMQLELARVRLASQVDWLSTEFDAKERKMSQLIGDVFNFKNGESTPLSRRKIAAQNLRREPTKE